MFHDKYRPRNLDELDIHPHLTERLRRLAHSEEFPHLLFYGPSGAGKQTRITAMLQELFGSGVTKIKAENKTFRKPSGAPFELCTLSSNYHFEVKPSDVGLYDRIVVRDMIKEIAQSAPIPTLGSSSGASGSNAGCSANYFKVIVLREVDSLTREAQQALRRTMEKYMSTCRLILCCESISKLLEPLRSRCLPIRVASPDDEQVAKVLRAVAKREKLQLPENMCKKLVEAARGNLRVALLMFETSRVQRYPFVDTQIVEKPHWESFIEGIADDCLREQSPKQVLEVRNKLYELIVNCIPPSVILTTLVSALLSRVQNESLQRSITKYSSHFEHRLHLGNKWIFHLEAFVARFMSLYKLHTLAQR